MQSVPLKMVNHHPQPSIAVSMNMETQINQWQTNIKNRGTKIAHLELNSSLKKKIGLCNDRIFCLKAQSKMM